MLWLGAILWLLLAFANGSTGGEPWEVYAAVGISSIFLVGWRIERAIKEDKNGE